MILFTALFCLILNVTSGLFRLQYASIKTAFVAKVFDRAIAFAVSVRTDAVMTIILSFSVALYSVCSIALRTEFLVITFRVLLVFKWHSNSRLLVRLAAIFVSFCSRWL